MKQSENLPTCSAKQATYSPPDASAEIVIHDLRRTYQIGGSDVHALRGVHLEVAHHEWVGIVGVSGSGKSTLLHLVGGLDCPDHGEVVVNGRSLGQMTAYELALYRRKTTGFVFQSFYLVPNLTAVENVRLALTLQGVYGQDRIRLADEAIARVGMEHRANHKPGQLSGGEQQRVTVARAIVNKPRLLLADEPTGNLDRATAGALMELLDKIRSDIRMTMLMVTHDEDIANKYCDRVIRMQDGRFI